MNKNNLSKEQIDRVNLTMSITQNGDYHAKLEDSLIDNEKYKECINNLELELLKSKSEYNKVSNDYKILKNVPVTERSEKILNWHAKYFIFIS